MCCFHSSLSPDEICHACGRLTPAGEWTQPEWKAATGGKQYRPSYNIGPTSYLPVLVSKKHFPDDLTNSSIPAEGPAHGTDESERSDSCDWVIQPMRWGLVPSWHAGDPNKVGYNMNNARSDTILKKRTFSGPLEKGRRCVVLVEGYFEWHRGQDGKKQPYFFYASGDQESSLDGETCTPVSYHGKTEMGNEGKENLDGKQESQPCKKRRRLLRMAALFDVSTNEKEGGPLHSFAVITVDAHQKLSSVHDRMPAILDGEAEVKEWLDFGSVPLKKAVCLLRPVDCVDFHPVSTIVNNVRNDTGECMEPIILGKRKETGSSKLMSAWLSQSKRPSDRDQTWLSQSKRPSDRDQTWLSQSKRPSDRDQTWLSQSKRPSDRDQTWLSQSKRPSDRDQTWLSQSKRPSDRDQIWLSQSKRPSDQKRTSCTPEVTTDKKQKT